MGLWEGRYTYLSIDGLAAVEPSCFVVSGTLLVSMFTPTVPFVCGEVAVCDDWLACSCLFFLAALCVVVGMVVGVILGSVVESVTELIAINSSFLRYCREFLQKLLMLMQELQH
jgi:ABC-type enterochelin transport system permease subunit